MNLNTLAVEIYGANVQKGFYEDNANLIEHLVKTGASNLIIETAKKAILGQRLSLIVSEVSEALEANRKDISFDNSPARQDPQLYKKQMSEDLDVKRFKRIFEEDVKDTFEDEIADAVIRLLDLCGAYTIDIDFHVSQKLRYNALRPHKHGKTY